MALKDMVAEVLLESEGAYVSGERIAANGGVSRMAVKKAVEALRKEGWPIEARTRMGYRMAGRADVLSSSVLESKLRGTGVKVFVLGTTASTNKDAKRLALEGVEPPFVVAAARQTGGRGRLGRSFESPEGGAYFSLVLPGSMVPRPDMVTLAAAWAVASVMERLTGEETALKWVNDVYIRGKKCVGILCEGIFDMETGGLGSVVIGTGVNLTTREEDFSPEVREKVTSFYPGGEGPVTRNDVIAECVKGIIGAQNEDFMDGYRKKCFVPGHSVTVLRAGTEKEAYAMEIDGRGHLVVRYSDGSVEALGTGDVSLRL